MNKTKAKMKTRETMLEVLIEIRDLLKAKQEAAPPIPSAELENNLITITDDGKKKTSELLAACKQLFPVWSYYSDSDLDHDFPPVKTSRSFLKLQEADEEHKNKSAEEFERQGFKGITLRERLIMELLYFKETGEHLDIKNITLCAGSRGRSGGVPGVFWDPGVRRLCVNWCDPRGAGGDLRARAAVS